MRFAHPGRRGGAALMKHAPGERKTQKELDLAVRRIVSHAPITLVLFCNTETGETLPLNLKIGASQSIGVV